MLSFEVMGPGGSLSMLLLLCHTGKMPVGECPGGRQWRQQQTVPIRRRRFFLSAVKTVGGSAEAAIFVCHCVLNYVFLYYLALFV
jgi:hypothetical protein